MRNLLKVRKKYLFWIFEKKSQILDLYFWQKQQPPLEYIQNTPIQEDVPGEPLFGKFIVAKSSEFALN